MQVFVDESGDAGTNGRGTRWLTFGMVCWPDDSAAILDHDLEAAALQLGRPIHFAQMRHEDKRGVTERLAASTAPWVGIVVATDTSAIVPGSALDKPDYQYNYALRFGLERVSRLAASLGEEAHVFIESRRASKTNGPLGYIEYLAKTDAPNFAWSALRPENVHLTPKGSAPSLCAADALAHAAFRVLEPDVRWGHLEASYFTSLAGRLWSPNGVVFDNGVVVMPTRLHRADRWFPMLAAPEK